MQRAGKVWGKPSKMFSDSRKMCKNPDEAMTPAKHAVILLSKLVKEAKCAAVPVKHAATPAKYAVIPAKHAAAW